MILAVLPPIAQDANFLCVLQIASGYCSALAIGTEILCRIEAEASHVSYAPCGLSIIRSSVCLCCIFDHEQVLIPCILEDRIHVSCLSVQMNWQDSFRARSDCSPNRGRIHVERSWIYVN